MLDPKKLQNGDEQYEEFYSFTLKKYFIQFDYRTMDGELFSCVAKNLSDAHKKLDDWRLEKAYQKST